jgi:hypothetical protein
MVNVKKTGSNNRCSKNHVLMENVYADWEVAKQRGNG